MILLLFMWILGLDVASRAYLTTFCGKIAECRGLSQAGPDPDLQESCGKLLHPLALSFSVK